MENRAYGVAGTAMKGLQNELSEEMRWHLLNYLRNSGEKVKIRP